MGKIKLNLLSGAVLEKPLINAFKASDNEYVVLDNETNGSMGLPIILVCKLENNKLIKIVDQNEWQIVKEYLKNIIAGNQIELIKVPNEIAADDIYYTQLTLPVPSFDALKKAYTLNENSNQEESELSTATMPETTVNEQVDIQVNNDVPVNEPEIAVSTPVEEPIVNQPVMPSVSEEPATSVEITPTPIVMGEINNINPTEPVVNIVSEPIMPSMPTAFEPEITSTPIIEPSIDLVTPSSDSVIVNDNVSSSESVFKEQKEAFMQACENMFDALVQKFEKELENK